MFRLSENYYLRQCFLDREQVPTQSDMIRKMSSPLAKVYFKSMTPKLKVLAGLEPPMKGGGSDWYVPPKELLRGRAVLKPIKKQYLTKLSFKGIGHFGEGLVEAHHKRLEEEKNRALLDNDINWKKTLEVSCRQEWEDCSKEAAKNNTEKIQQAFHEFTTLYMTSINKIENILFDAAILEIKRTKAASFKKMKDHYEHTLKQQSTMLYDRYTEKLTKKKAELKAQFIAKVEEARTDMADTIHDINMEKHIAIEKVRQLLECQKMACQVYVALKEREACRQETELAKHEHKKKVKTLTDEIAIKDFEIKLALEKEKKRAEFDRIWQKKVCEVVKKFQVFVGYCLNTLPQHAEFFLNMEKLMMMQLDQAMENPVAESIFEKEDDGFHTPIARPHPFFLFCDKGYKPQLDQDLCPKHCTSSATQLPVIIVNKRCIYAACDNFQVYTDKIKEYIHGKRGDDADFEDDHQYEHDVPVQYTESQKLKELKLENSLLQVLQSELPNVKQVPVECCVCKIPYCFCSPTQASQMSISTPRVTNQVSTETVHSGNRIKTRAVELKHHREPKMQSYMDYVMPKRCKCAKTAKKHLTEHLPPYMQLMSRFEEPDLPNYEQCPLHVLKKLVKKARGQRTPPPEPSKPASKTRNAVTQYSDQEFEQLCTCFSDEEVDRLYRECIKGSKMFRFEKSEEKFNPVDMSVSPSYLSKDASTFATDRAYSLRNLMGGPPFLEELFKKEDCYFD